MTNTKFRKRALLSSVAMLLVALVALGSATFAWFTANPNAEARGLNLRTTASAGLVIKTDTDDNWGHNALLGVADSSTITGGDSADRTATFFNANLTPVSQDPANLGDFWTVAADNAAAYGAKSGATMEKVAAGHTASSAVYSESIYCRLSDGSDTTANASKKVYITGVTITAASGATMDTCIRVAIARGTTLLGTYAISGNQPNGRLLTASATANSEAFVTTLPIASNVDTGLTALSANASDKSKALTVYVYLDGQDTNCFSDKVGTVNANKIIESIKIDLTLGD